MDITDFNSDSANEEQVITSMTVEELQGHRARPLDLMPYLQFKITLPGFRPLENSRYCRRPSLPESISNPSEPFSAQKMK